MDERKKSWVAIGSIWLVLLILAAIRPLSLPDEGRYGDVGRWMFMSGDWLIPRLNGIPFFHKPPLLYWLQAAVFHFTGVHVWTARLVVAGHALVMLVCLYLGVRQIRGENFARKVVLVLGCSVGFLIGGQFLNHDFLVATWMTVATGLFALAFQSQEKTNLFLARLGFVACGFGFLSKGLIGVALPGLVIFTWLLVTGQIRRLLDFPWCSGLLLFFGVALPWLVRVQSQFPDFLNYFIIEQHFARFKGTHFNNPQPWWFYLPVIAIFMFPWFFLVAWDLINRLKAGFNFENVRCIQLDRWTALPWIWFLVILLFFSIPQSKLVGYILPAIPPVALLVVDSWERITANTKASAIWFWSVCALSALTAVGANFLARYNSLKDASLDVAHVLHCNFYSGDRVYVAGDFPHDLSFVSNLQQPILIVQDWAIARKTAVDDWRRIFFEGADFDPLAGQVLQEVQSLNTVQQDGQSWLVTPAGFQLQKTPHLWDVVYKGTSWWLWRSGYSLAVDLTVPSTVNAVLQTCQSPMMNRRDRRIGN